MPATPITPPTPTDGGRLLRIDELAERWGVSRGWIYGAIQRGALPTVKLGRSRRVRVADADRFVAELAS